MKSIWIVLLTFFLASSNASAQLGEAASAGERQSFLVCAYECNPGPIAGGVPTFRNITTVLLTNQSPDERFAELYYFDGNENCVAHSSVHLSSVDLDEINICHSLDSGGITTPIAGLVEILVTDSPNGAPADGVYGVVKNLFGKFKTDNPEPFGGRVKGIGKFECRVVPGAVQPQVAVAAKCAGSTEIASKVVENTAECDCADPDFNQDGNVNFDDFAEGVACHGLPAVGACAKTDLNCDGTIDYDVGGADGNLFMAELGGPGGCL